MKKRKIIFQAAIVVLVLFFLSLSLQIDREGKKNKLNIHIDLKGIRPLLASSHYGQWDGVRDIASFVRNVSDALDKIIVDIANSGVLRAKIVLTDNDGTYKIKFDPAANKIINSVTYTIGLELWLAADDSKVLEIWFDDPDAKDQVLVIWQPNKFDSDLRADLNPKIACSMAGGYKDGTMICSWSDGPFLADPEGVIDHGRIKAEADSVNGEVRIQALARLEATDDQCAFLGRDFYALAFISKISKPYYTTARWGLNDENDDVQASFCRSILSSVINNYGYFNTSVNAGYADTDSRKYYVRDGVTLADEDSKYPTISDVEALFDEMANAGSDTDMKIAQINSFDGTPVIFEGSAAPGF